MTAFSRPQPLTISSDRVGLLRCDHFQVSYVTNDMDAAVQKLKDDYRITEFQFLEGQMPAGGSVRVAFAWVGSTMYELIAAEGPGSDFYNSRLPDEGEGLAIRFHHLGFLVPNADTLKALEQQFRDAGRAVVLDARVPGYLDALYVEAPEFGHYLEYILLHEDGSAFFNSIPLNS
jgi:hypothetical protein